MKKKIIFIIPSMRSGGAEKSLITLLSLLDYGKYEVDLLLFRQDGLFINKIPEKVHVIDGTKNYEIFDGDAKNAVKYFSKKLKFISAFERYKYSKAINFSDEYKRASESWKYLKKQLPKIKKKYDVSIGYLEGNASKFAVDDINAERKIVYVHNDISKLNLNRKFNTEIFEKADKIVTVSQECKEALQKEYSEYYGKIEIIENIVSPELMKKSAEKENVFDKADGKIHLLTVGRCFEQKNIALAVRTCKLLKDSGKQIKWYHIGNGPLFNQIKELIDELDLKNDFIMLGEHENPYPYIWQCDIYVQTSLYEGKSIAVDEAKCLDRPIVVTNFSTVYDQITDGINGLIAEMNEESLSDKIGMLIDSPELRNELSENLKKEALGNENELKKFYKITEE